MTARQGLLVFVAALLVVAVLSWTTTFTQANQTANDSKQPLAARLTAAKLARSLAPWDAAADVRYAMLRGGELFNSGQWDAARDLLYTTYLRHIGNDPLLAQLTKVEVAIDFRDAGKAHVQHGRETTTGALRPQDVIP